MVQIQTQLYQSLNKSYVVGQATNNGGSYKELFDHLNGNISLPDAVEKIKLNTRHYAKRQMTWFKKDKEVKWFKKAEAINIINFLNY